MGQLYFLLQLFQCGFNAGDNTHWLSITSSRNVSVLDLPYKSNVNQKGVWMFRIDKAKVEEGGCNTKGRITTFVFIFCKKSGATILVILRGKLQNVDNQYQN